MVLGSRGRVRTGPGLTPSHISINMPFVSGQKQGWNVLSAASGTDTGLRSPAV